MSDYSNIEPIHIQGIVDSHVHCDYSVDAEGTIEQYCEAALARDLAEICFTTHFDYDPDEKGGMNVIRVKSELLPTNIENLKPYVDHVKKAADTFYRRGLSVKLGVEFGWYQGCEGMAQKLKAAYPFDYFLCGIHQLDNIDFSCPKTSQTCFENYPVNKFAAAYFDQVKIAAATGLFDTIAHLEYYMKFAGKFYGDSINEIYKEHLESVFEALKKSGTSLEINTAANRHGVGDYYPRIQIINAAKKSGVKVWYLGSDAHRPDQIGYDFEMAATLVPDNIRGCEE